MSPLSDTTNVAALAAEVPPWEHIRAMTYTTMPSALITGILYFVLGFVYGRSKRRLAKQAILGGIETMFNFNLLLLIP